MWRCRTCRRSLCTACHRAEQQSPDPPACGDQHIVALQAAEARLAAAAAGQPAPPLAIQENEAPGSQEIAATITRAAQLARLAAFLDDLAEAGPTFGT
eukprot:1217616-Lingulodinium_polyedra.AAC.1